MVNKIWALFIIGGSIFFIMTGKLELLNQILLNSAKESLDMILKLFPVIAMWLGITKIASVSGLLHKMSQFLSPLLGKLFPEIPKGHDSLSLITSNVIANFFGLGNAATPFGLKAMKELQRLNNTTTASRSMITFLVINTSSVTIIPATVISIRILNNSINPTSIVPLTIITTFISTFLALVLDRLFYILWRKRYD